MHTYLYANFPAVMKFLDTWDKTTYRKALPLALSQTRFRDEFNNADATPYQALPWIFMAPGSDLAARRRLRAVGRSEAQGRSDVRRVRYWASTAVGVADSTRPPAATRRSRSRSSPRMLQRR